MNKDTEIRILKYFNQGEFKKVYKEILPVYKKKPNSDLSNKLGVVFDKLNKKKIAEYFYKNSLKLGKNYKAYYNLSLLITNLNISMQYINNALQIQNTCEARLHKSNLLIREFKYKEIVKLLLGKCNCEKTNFLLGLSYQALGNTEESILYFEKSIKSEDLYINFLFLNFFPRVYKSTKELNSFRDKFKKQLKNCETIVDKNIYSINEKKNIITSSTNFLLSYQQKNDLELNKNYFKLLKKLLNLNAFKVKNFNSKKILFISSFFYQHTVAKLFYKFAKEFCQIDEFSIHLLHTSQTQDTWTKKFKNLNAQYWKITRPNEIHSFLYNHKFETIIFLDHAMSNITQYILLNKYAKNYFVLWGHPITTGCENVDYFISSELMDDKNDDHYSEKLINLKGVGFNYKINETAKSVKLENNDTNNNFFVMQSLFKLLPKYDFLYYKILEYCPKAKLVFIKDKDIEYTNRFIDRLKKNKYTNKKLNQIHLAERMSQREFFQEISRCKVVIDSVGWSGGNTTMEAIYFDKPVVTLRGNNLRSNHSSAILKAIDLDVLVAKDYNEYISKACKLMTDNNFYQKIIDNIKSNKYKLFDKNISLYDDIKSFL